MSDYATKTVTVGGRTYCVHSFRGEAERVEVRFSIERRDRWGIGTGNRCEEWRKIWAQGLFRPNPAGPVTRAAIKAAGATIREG